MIAKPFPRVLGLTGYKGSGKDAACHILQGLVWGDRVAFADPLRNEAQRILDGYEPIPEDAPEQLRKLYSEQIADGGGSAFDKPYPQRIRLILQMHGTEFRRKQDGDYWIKAWSGLTAGKPQVYCTDVRFPNEEELIHSLGGEVWWIYRGQPDDDQHESEAHIHELHHDRIIDNTGALEDLERAIRSILRRDYGLRLD